MVNDLPAADGTKNALMSMNQFTERFLGGVDPEAPTYVDIGGELPLPVRVLPSAGSKTLVVLLHGAIDRDRRQLPAFMPYRSGLEAHAHQMAIADPALTLHEGLTNAWFCGAQETPLQQLLPPLFNKLQADLCLDRIVFMGGSGGGFGALFNSFHVPKSIAVVAVPQTNINEYYSRRRDCFLRVCWPRRRDGGEGGPILDLRELYKRASSNAIVYVQSALDEFHMSNHMLPFLGALPKKKQARLVLKCSYWGKPKHSGAVPVQEWDGWLHAAIASPSVKAEDIINAYYASGVETVPSAALKVREQREAQRRSLQENAPRTGDGAVRLQQDLTWADMVASHVMKAREKSGPERSTSGAGEPKR